MEDKSIFQGWVETSHHRFEEKGNDIWGAYEKQASPFGLDWAEVKRQLDRAKDDGQMTNAIIWNADNGKSIRVDF